MSMPPHGADLAWLRTLDDRVRSRLYAFVSESTEPVGRDEAAAAVGIGRPLAAYHLDKLVASGLLTASYRRPPGKAGPGAGRPAKVYTRSASEFMVTVPPREYELAARLLARAVAADHSGQSLHALHEAALRLGAEVGSRCLAGGARDEHPERALEAALSEHGFEPWGDHAGTIRLRNCPFRTIAVLEPDVVCGMNLALIEGLVAGLRAGGLHPMLDPRPGFCCVAISAGKPRPERL